MADSSINTPTSGVGWKNALLYVNVGFSENRVFSRSYWFLAAAYLLIVIPGLLAAGGMDKGAANHWNNYCLRHCQFINGILCEFTICVGPGIGGSVLVGITLAGSEGIDWQIGLGIACWSGILFFPIN